jgi:hypothetical protein
MAVTVPPSSTTAFCGPEMTGASFTPVTRMVTVLAAESRWPSFAVNEKVTVAEPPSFSASWRPRGS